MITMPPIRCGAPAAAEICGNVIFFALAIGALVFVSSKAEAMKIQEVKARAA